MQGCKSRPKLHGQNAGFDRIHHADAGILGYRAKFQTRGIEARFEKVKYRGCLLNRLTEDFRYENRPVECSSA